MSAPAKISLQEWIKGTKVLDKDGKPLVLYHGTMQLFDRFVESEKPLVPGSLRGHYFSSDKGAAAEYGKNLIIALVNLKNPFVGLPMDRYREVYAIERPGFGSSPEVFARNKRVTPQAVKEWLIDQGYDGVIIPSGASYFDHDEVIAFHADQIRIIKTMTPEMAPSASNPHDSRSRSLSM
ncbi:hypothetical protein RYA05_03715 [Pseudomonas syringae pv. actinidiae]|nr:hypothetical protein [Pseudomonas syringae pv. actinidiae]